MLIRQRQQWIYFRLTHETGGFPFMGVKVYGIMKSEAKEVPPPMPDGRILLPNEFPKTHLRLLGKTNNQGEFKHRLRFGGLSVIAFDIDHDYNLPNKFAAHELCVSPSNPKPKDMLVKMNGMIYLA